MKYFNPFLALDLVPEKWKHADGETLRRKKKEMLAEAEAEADQNIHLPRGLLNRNEIIELFRELEDESSRLFHAEVALHPRLLTFLEEAELDYFYEGDISLLGARDADFLERIAPYFTRSYNLRLTNAFRQRDVAELHILCVHPMPFPMKYLDLAYRDTQRLLHEHWEAVDAHVGWLDQGAAPGGEIQELTDERWIDSTNALPEYFQDLRNALGDSFQQMSLSLYLRHQRPQLALLVLRQSLKLHLSAPIKQKLLSLQQSIFEIHPEEQWRSWLRQFEDKQVDPWVVALGLGITGALVWLLTKWIG